MKFTDDTSTNPDPETLIVGTVMMDLETGMVGNVFGTPAMIGGVLSVRVAFPLSVKRIVPVSRIHIEILPNQHGPTNKLVGLVIR